MMSHIHLLSVNTGLPSCAQGQACRCSHEGHDSVLILVMINTSKMTEYDIKESTVFFFGGEGGTKVDAKHFGGKRQMI